MRSRILCLAGAGLAVTLAGCWALDMNYVPAAGDLQQHLPELIVPGAQPVGIYANIDVDSRVFKYTLPASEPAPAEVLARLEKSARKQGWQVRERKAGMLRLNRFEDTLPKGGGYFSSEEARIVLDGKGVVHVGWVQADTRNRVSRFEDAGGQARWAEQVIWPRLPGAVLH